MCRKWGSIRTDDLRKKPVLVICSSSRSVWAAGGTSSTPNWDHLSTQGGLEKRKERRMWQTLVVSNQQVRPVSAAARTVPVGLLLGFARG